MMPLISTVFFDNGDCGGVAHLYCSVERRAMCASIHYYLAQKDCESSQKFKRQVATWGKVATEMTTRWVGLEAEKPSTEHRACIMSPRNTLPSKYVSVMGRLPFLCPTLFYALHPVHTKEKS